MSMNLLMGRGMEWLSQLIRRGLLYGAGAGAGLLAHPGWSAPSPTPPPTDFPAIIPGWRIELVGQSPAINHPSVVATAPDGRVFVAEDPMDITAPADARQGRILCLFPDGHRTVFATNLHAVFGLQYLEGKLYVLHNPRFTVFRDVEGRGADPDDLIPSTLPNPWALDWNDHVPANFKLAMDGYFYIAVGDKGLFGATGKDGRKVNLHGGGVVRIRPDGTGLEIFSTGVRNILDVALNEEDEIFTYDNTDEQQWMGRVTHMVDGGFYGYPFDFIPRRPYTLWMFADYGGGAATGALIYDDDALPAENHGALFLADFGKRQVMRVRLERDGATFKAVQKTDLFPNPPPDFRPVGITWTADAQGFYLCDWQHRDVKGTNAVGRLWKVTQEGLSRAAVRPSWWVDAAMGREMAAANIELLEGLSHPARSVRLTAQRRLADRGGAVAPMLTQFLETKSMAPWARTHALWALDAIDGGKSAERSITTLLKDPQFKLRAQAARQLGQRQRTSALTPLTEALQDPHPLVRFHAATALGRIASPASIPSLMSALGESDFFTRYALFHALRRIGEAQPDTWSTLAGGLTHRDPRIMQGVQFALRDVYHPTLAGTLSQMARDTQLQEQSRRAATELLAQTHSKSPPWNGEWWAYHPANSKPPARTLPWDATPTIAATLRDLLNPQHPESLRILALRGLAEARDHSAVPSLHVLTESETNLTVRIAMIETLTTLKDPQSIPVVAHWMEQPQTPPETIPALLQAIQALPSDSARKALLQFLRSRATTTGMVAPVLAALGNWPQADVAEAIQPFIKNPTPTIRLAALTAWTRVSREGAAPRLLDALQDPSPEIRRFAIQKLGQLKVPESIPHLITLAANPLFKSDVLAALGQLPSLQALDLHVEGLNQPNPSLREPHRKAIALFQKEALPKLESRIQTIPSTALAELQSLYDTNVAARKGPLFSHVKAQPSQDDYDRFASQHSGDVQRGKIAFHNRQGAACIQCHKVGAEGGRVGPDLSQAGAQFGKATLIESVLYPSKAIREGYQQWIVETSDGEIQTGILRSESSEEIQLMDTEGRVRSIPTRQIAERTKSSLSLMPEGLQGSLSLQDFADLIAYLQSLK